MPARRPYASRGVPRRATTRRSASRLRPAFALLGVVAVAILGTAWAAYQIASPVRPPASVSAAPEAAAAQPASSARANAVADLADAPLPRSRAETPSEPELAPLSRHWETGTVDGISTDQ